MSSEICLPAYRPGEICISRIRPSFFLHSRFGEARALPFFTHRSGPFFPSLFLLSPSHVSHGETLFLDCEITILLFPFPSLSLSLIFCYLHHLPPAIFNKCPVGGFYLRACRHCCMFLSLFMASPSINYIRFTIRPSEMLAGGGGLSQAAPPPRFVIPTVAPLC